MTRSWIIGSKPECDLVVNLPAVSGRHCRLTQDDAGFALEDLQSTNGTFVNGSRITGIVRISSGDRVTLGLTAPMPWPSDHASPVQGDVSRFPTLTFRGESILVGRGEGCDRVLDFPMVSGKHARLVRSGNQVLVEDVGSSNGTFVNGQQIARPTPVRPGDLISLGSYTVVFGIEPEARVMPPVPTGTPVVATAVMPAITPFTSSSPAPVAIPTSPTEASDVERQPEVRTGGFVEELAATLRPPARLAALLGQAPLIALVLVAVFRVDSRGLATPEGWASASASVAAVLSWLSLAAVWFGLSNAILGTTLGAPAKGRDEVWGRGAGVARVLARFAVFGGLCVAQCFLAWMIVAFGAGLAGSGLPSLVLLVLAAVVGLALGLVVVELAPTPALAWAFLPVAMLPLWLLGGQAKALPEMASWARVVSNALPSRWAFEGLLLLESERHLPPPPVEEAATPSAPSPGRDLAEGYFPAEVDRMGVRAAAIALAAMLVGLTASAAFISEEAAGSRRSP